MIPAALFIPAYAVYRAGPVVPENQGIVFGRTVLRGIIEKRAQGAGIAHIGRCQGILDAVVDFPLARKEAENGVLVIRERVLPFPAAACHDQQIDLLRVKPGRLHFSEVIRGGAVQAFQIASRHVDHDRHRFLRSFCPGGGRKEGRQERHEEKHRNDPHQDHGPAETYMAYRKS